MKIRSPDTATFITQSRSIPPLHHLHASRRNEKTNWSSHRRLRRRRVRVSRRGLTCEGVLGLSCVDAGKKGTKRGSPVVFLVPGSGAAVAVWVAVSRASPEQRPFESCLRGGGVKVAYPRLSSRSVVATSPVSIHAAGKLSARWCGEAELEVVGDQWQRVERDREGREPCKGRER